MDQILLNFWPYRRTQAVELNGPEINVYLLLVIHNESQRGWYKVISGLSCSVQNKGFTVGSPADNQTKKVGCPYPDIGCPEHV